MRSNNIEPLVARMNSNPAVLAYPIREACAVSGIGRTKVYALITTGELEARQCGGRTLIPAASLKVYLEKLPLAPIRKRVACEIAAEG